MEGMDYLENQVWMEFPAEWVLMVFLGWMASLDLLAPLVYMAQMEKMEKRGKLGLKDQWVPKEKGDFQVPEEEQVIDLMKKLSIFLSRLWKYFYFNFYAVFLFTPNCILIHF